ncbi:AAA family ATPase [Candidatus Marithrix sp. Canyon 246]|uniref:AAA family ATPase n=1 Tax=Candidatus Marithrix sp. Canyon 246 TaxID=1827136 RepID=UPI00084A18A4|nr:AAA family ATPase [Candidatus Marithrix sp. Canyon 246]
MYIKSIHIKEFRIFKDLDINFQPPENGENVINVIAGVNGCGKTTLLEIFFQYFKGDLSDSVQIKTDINKKNENPRLIFIPANLTFKYKPTSQLNTNYQFLNLIDENILGKTETYIREYILSIERESHLANPEERTNLAISQFNKPFRNTKLLTTLHDLDKNRFNRPVFKNIKGDLVTIDQLSDGEKQLYGRVVALMMLEPRNSMILIDEPETSLHPAWQQ